ncbi:DUF7948 domain-containing protein [Hymenobacter swuensis]|uniref:PKD domain-containing protein n=1 Tax=Hymenobacter swuensis DY53 TaxID=1227739 RepID=W8F1M7_9BACT|nr:gliding motility-associated C-terminal domain-containing protein [Hymenobacter swuensis]AHJ99314.1 hypothetical protein Hsw_3719 [Hymenobacter swuensis DY53]
MKQLYLFVCLLWLPNLLARASAPTPDRHLEFIENKGQWPAPVLYAADVPGGRLFLEPGGLTYALTTGFPHPHTATPRAGSTPEAFRVHALRVEFVQAAQPVVLPSAATGEIRNYLRGSDPSQWATHVAGFRQLQYRNVWPGVEVKFYENQQQQLEYDFELAPQARPATIRLRYHGADALRLTPEGHLEIQTSVGTLRELAPKAWQLNANGQRQAVPCAYVLHNQEVSFHLGKYDSSRPLIIDPTVVFSTFTGSATDNWGFTATYDQQGNLYSGGIVFALGYPTSPGAYSTQFAGATDIALIKYNTTARGPAARVWATYLGGSGADFPQSLVVNSLGELLILAATGSNNFPVTASALDRTFNGGSAINPFFGYAPSNMPEGSDLAVVRLSADGSRLVASTYLGGAGNEGVLPNTSFGFNLLRNYGDQFRGDILVDAQNNVYLASNTSSSDFPARNNFQPYTPGLNAVVSKLTPSLDQVVWSSQLGGNQPDAAYSLQLDAAGRLYVAGGTTSPNFPVTPGTVQPAQRGDADGFVARISSSGSVLEKATVVGTSAYDQAYFVQLDQSGGVYLLGQTMGAYPTVGNRYGVANSRQFIHKFNADLTTTEFATTFGSGRATIDLSPTAFLVDQCERIYVSGWGGGNNVGYGNGNVLGMPTTTNATQRTTDGSDFYLLQLSAGARNLDYATFFGGTSQDHVDGGTSRFDPRGVVYQAVCGGCGGSSSWPIPPGAGYYSTFNASVNCNNAAFKFNFETVDVVAGTDQTVCVASAPVPLQGSPAGGIWTGPGVSGSVAAGFVFTPTQALLGTQTLTYTVTGVGPCGGVSSLRLTVVPSPPITFTAPAQTSFCLGPTNPAPVTLSATPAGGTFSGPGVSGNLFIASLAGPGTHTLVYTVNASGCRLQTTRTVTVTQAFAGASLNVCAGAGPQALTGTPAGGVWTGPGVATSVTGGFTFTPTVSLLGIQTLTYTVTAPGGCTSSSTMQAYVLPVPTFTPPVLPAYCTTNTTPILLPSVAYWGGPGVQGPSSMGFTFRPSLAGVGTHTLLYRTGGGLCDYTGTITVTVSAPISVNAGPDTLLCPGTTRPFRLRGTPAGGTWSGSGITPDGVFTPSVSFSGSSTLTYTVPGVCLNTGSRRVSIAAPPATAPVWTPAGCPENRLSPLTLTFSGGAPTSSWEFGDGTPAITGNTVTHTYTQAGTYQPRVTTSFNAGRCTETASLPTVEVIATELPPNIITPNHDDKNQFFVVRTACPGQLQVFSRWGNKVFEAAHYLNNWDGAGLPDGVYYYLLRTPDGHAVKGWVTIQR